MGDVTGISWCDHTYNVWIGCTKVSEGCRLCYAERDNERWHRTDRWGDRGQRRKSASGHRLTTWGRRYWGECGACGWRGEMELFPECPQCHKPELRPTRQRVFVNSLSDLFEDRAELVPWRNEFWALTQICTGLDFLILTKRPENINRLGPRDWRFGFGWPQNIWLGTSVENQRRADERLPDLMNVPATVRWLSVEPMLEPIDLWRWLPSFAMQGLPAIQWVVCGGESGPGCWPMHTDWARRLRDQCQTAGVAFYMKQLGGAVDRREELSDLPRDLRIREWPEVKAPAMASP